MSRIGRLPVPVPSGVEVTLTGSHLKVTGGNGSLERTLPPAMRVVLDDSVIRVERPSDTTTHRALHGLTRSLIANMVEGVSRGYTRNLELVGVGYRVAKQGGDLVLNLGYSHPIRYTPPEAIQVEVPAATLITVRGASKELVGQVAAKIRSFRKPEPYKGKGVLYRGERIRRKVGKSGKAGKGR